LKEFFETVAGQLKPIGSKSAITRDKIYTFGAETWANTAHQDADKRCVVTVQDETVDEMEVGLADGSRPRVDFHNFDFESAPLAKASSTTKH
jgi:hypothetical protein